MLVELKADGSEHERLLNDTISKKSFFVEENLMKNSKMNTFV